MSDEHKAVLADLAAVMLKAKDCGLLVELKYYCNDLGAPGSFAAGVRNAAVYCGVCPNGLLSLGVI